MLRAFVVREEGRDDGRDGRCLLFQRGPRACALMCARIYPSSHVIAFGYEEDACARRMPMRV